VLVNRRDGGGSGKKPPIHKGVFKGNEWSLERRSGIGSDAEVSRKTAQDGCKLHGSGIGKRDLERTLKEGPAPYLKPSKFFLSGWPDSFGIGGGGDGSKLRPNLSCFKKAKRRVPHQQGEKKLGTKGAPL